MKIGVIGSGGREHAIVWKLAKYHRPEDIYFLPGNGGYKNSVALDIGDFGLVKSFCEEREIKLLIIGAEAPLAAGIVEAFQGSSIRVFGPNSQAAQLESSKIWSKKFMRKYGVATAEFWPFQEVSEARSCVEELEGNLVIKYDGLAGGKGVYVCSSTEEAYTALASISEHYGDKTPILVERKLQGEELSLLAVTNGEEVCCFPAAQDYKRALDNHMGPNTGGMGAYTPISIWSDELEEQIQRKIVGPTLNGLHEEAIDYCGFLYFGIMVTDEGPQLLEYNVRLGDPETQVILPTLKSDLLTVITACMNKTLSRIPIEFNKEAFVDVVLTSKGYPGHYETGHPISGIDTLDADTLLFHGGTRQENGKLVSNGGRVLNVVTRGETVEQAVEKAYSEVNKIHFEGVIYRKDIGKCPVLT